MSSFHCSSWSSERHNCLIWFCYHRSKRDKGRLKYMFEFMVEKMAEAQTQMPNYFFLQIMAIKNNISNQHYKLWGPFSENFYTLWVQTLKWRSIYSIMEEVKISFGRIYHDYYFCGIVARRKAFSLISSCGKLSAILNIANLRHAASSIWTCAESDSGLVITITPRCHDRSCWKFISLSFSTIGSNFIKQYI